MGRITFTAEAQHEDIIENVKTEIDAESTAAAVRECIERAVDLQQCDEGLQQREEALQQQLENVKQENERLQNEKRTLINQRKETTELVEYIEQQRDLERYRARREQMVDQAGMLTRWKWKFTGVPVEKGSAERG